MRLKKEKKTKSDQATEEARLVPETDLKESEHIIFHKEE